MLCYLPAPYPDELLYSVIARYVVQIGAKDASEAAVQIFGRKMITRVGLPGSLDIVSERTWPVWQMTGADIAKQLTLFPYYSYALPESRALKCLEILRSDCCQGLSLRFGLSMSSVKLPQFLRFCRTCREHNMQTYGETYWRRSHQLVGVLVCPEHGEELIDTNVPMQSLKRGKYIDATLITTDPELARNDDTLSEKEATIALRVAIRCQEILHGQAPQWPKEDLRMAYRRAVIERGFAKYLIMLSHAKIEEAFVTYYGTLLSLLGCEVTAGQDYSWIRLIVRGHVRGSYHPAYHALFQVFLESVPVDPDRRIHFSLGPWKCPNPSASHKDPLPVKNAVYEKSACGMQVEATCACGLRFTFSRTSETDQRMPVVTRILQPVQTWKDEARLLMKCGLDDTAIAARLKLSIKTVRGMLKRQQNPGHGTFNQLPFGPDILEGLPTKKKWRFHVSLEEIAQWRQEWLRLLSEVPNHSWHQARKKNEGLYSKLSYYDRDWMNAQAKIPNELSIPERVDWQDRDKRWGPMLRAAAGKIRSELPCRKITKAAVIKEAGLEPTSILQRLDRLPECRSALDECVETRDDYHERRLCTTMAEVSPFGKPLSRTQLLRRCSIKSRNVSPRIREVLERLFQG